MSKTFKKRVQQFKDSFYKGIGWAFGVTVGFALVSTVLVFILSKGVGLPLVGGVIANVIQATNSSLPSKGPTSSK